MLFDHDDPNIEVKNPYENNDVLKIKLKRKNTLRVRMSDWVETRKIVVSIDGRVIAPLVLDGWLYLDNLQGNEMIAVQIPMKSYVEEYPFREDVFKVRWKGDSVIAMANFGKRLCYFEDL
jgi:hypothetical protein